MMHVCDTAVGVLGDMSKFPDEWLFNHRWGKGKKDAATTLPNGAKIMFLTVGGRTSCVVPSVQKKTGAVAGDLKNGEEMKVKKKAAAKKGKAAVEEDEDKEPGVEVKKEPASRKRKAAPKVEYELAAEKTPKSDPGAKKWSRQG
jgi:formamidopyrimidine-DNA glycosylase